MDYHRWSHSIATIDPFARTCRSHGNPRHHQSSDEFLQGGRFTTWNISDQSDSLLSPHINWDQSQSQPSRRNRGVLPTRWLEGRSSLVQCLHDDYQRHVTNSRSRTTEKTRTTLSTSSEVGSSFPSNIEWNTRMNYFSVHQSFRWVHRQMKWALTTARIQWYSRKIVPCVFRYCLTNR